MALDWIKIEHSLPNKPEVMQLAMELQISEFEVVGHLVCFWSWVDQNMSPECPHVVGTKLGLDRVAGRTGFVDAMVNVGWLEFCEGRVHIPNYEHHLSQSSKRRALASKKKAIQRANVPQSVPTNVPTTGGQIKDKKGDQRREEKNINTPLASAKGESETDVSHVPASEIVKFWNSVWGTNARLTEKRRTAIRARWRDPWWRENWQDAIRRTRESSFCAGENDRGWTANLDWMLRPDTATKVLEGEYDDREKTAGSSGSGGYKTAASQRHESNMAALQDFLHEDDGSPGDEQVANGIEARAPRGLVLDASHLPDEDGPESDLGDFNVF